MLVARYSPMLDSFHPMQNGILRTMSSLMIIFHMDTPRSLRKTFLGCKTDLNFKICMRSLPSSVSSTEVGGGLGGKSSSSLVLWMKRVMNVTV